MHWRVLPSPISSLNTEYENTIRIKYRWRYNVPDDALTLKYFSVAKYSYQWKARKRASQQDIPKSRPWGYFARFSADKANVLIKFPLLIEFL